MATLIDTHAPMLPVAAHGSRSLDCVLPALARERLALLGEKAACLAHEIRNPLTAIGGFAGRLAESPHLDAAERNRARLVAAEAKRLEAMLSSVLAFARPMQGETVDLAALAAQCLDILGMGGCNGVTLEVAANTPVPARATADHVRQCLLNLVKNAMEAVAVLPQKGTVRVLARNEGSWAVLRVEDDGIGMTTDQLARAFVPFATSKLCGTGLGLAMTRRLVEDMGGSLLLESTLGQGTTATMVLPAA